MASKCQSYHVLFTRKTSQTVRTGVELEDSKMQYIYGYIDCILCSAINNAIHREPELHQQLDDRAVYVPDFQLQEALRWAVADVAGVMEEQVVVSTEDMFAPCGRGLQQAAFNVSEVVTSYEIRIPSSVEGEEKSVEIAEQVRAALDAATKTGLAAKIKEAFLLQSELAEVAVAVSILGEPLLEVLQTTFAEVPPATESKYPSLVPEAVTISSASASILAIMVLILYWRQSSKHPTSVGESSSVSFVGVTPADADAMSPQFKEDVMLSSIDIFDEQMPAASQQSFPLSSKSFPTQKAQPESGKQVPSPRPTRRKVWRAVPIPRDGGEKEEEEPRRGRAKRKARRASPQSGRAQPTELHGIVVEDPQVHHCAEGISPGDHEA
ncbi:unnamed protein product [Symbiodinium natans]|uniref:Uncharacterized protein n=1 Tax=Symbiodinium natans TaxID=878477 RepID=A0A812SIY4_9DINO|nr:unnamed protein product [Symbiodinium natans]